MKKIYVQPRAEIVSVNLIGTVLDEPSPGMGNNSYETEEGDAKQCADFVEEDAFRSDDLWSSNTSHASLWDE